MRSMMAGQSRITSYSALAIRSSSNEKSPDQPQTKHSLLCFALSESHKGQTFSFSSGSLRAGGGTRGHCGMIGRSNDRQAR
jgi:hypothetical protein